MDHGNTVSPATRFGTQSRGAYDVVPILFGTRARNSWFRLVVIAKRERRDDTPLRNKQVFAPFSYRGLSARKWDLVVIEGYTGSVPAFIQEVRLAGNFRSPLAVFPRIGQNVVVVILIHCLSRGSQRGR